MTRIIFAFLVTLATAAVGQTSNLVVFSDGAENFTLFVNGIRMNAEPTSNARATNLVGDMCKVRVVFEKTSIPEISKNIMIVPGEEQSFGIIKNKKGEYVIRLNSSGPIPKSAEVQPVIVRETVAQPTPSATTVSPTNTASSSVTTVTTTTTQQQAAPQQGNLSMSMNTPEGNLTMSINVSDGNDVGGAAVSVSGLKVSGAVTTTSSTITTTSSQVQPAPLKEEPAPAPVNTSTRDCAFSNSDFSSALSSIKSKSFADVKMSTSKQAIRNRCITTNQAKQIIQLFEFEDDKLEFAKHAYASVSDKENYFQISDLFAHASTQDEFNEFLEAQN